MAKAILSKTVQSENGTLSRYAMKSTKYEVGRCGVCQKLCDQGIGFEQTKQYCYSPESKDAEWFCGEELRGHQDCLVSAQFTRRDRLSSEPVK